MRIDKKEKHIKSTYNLSKKMIVKTEISNELYLE